MVVPSLTVAENVFLGRPPRRGGRRIGVVDWRRMREQTREVMAEWGFDVERATPPAGNLTVEQRQVVEITRALAAGTRCLLLDEPTAALERGAAQRLFERIRQLQAQSSVAILYISHHLEEVFEICTDIAVLRDGEMVLTAPLGEVTKDDLVAAMVGPKLLHAERPLVSPPGPTEPPVAAAPAANHQALVVEGVTFASPGVFLGNVSLTIRGGERVGVTGLRGSGATTLARIVAGAAAPDAGRVRLGEVVLRPGDRAGALRAGVGCIPEDRRLLSAEAREPSRSAAVGRRVLPREQRARRSPRRVQGDGLDRDPAGRVRNGRDSLRAARPHRRASIAAAGTTSSPSSSGSARTPPS